MREVIGYQPEASKSGDNTWARIGIRKAEAFTLEYGVSKALEFKSLMQERIFNLYFAHYVLRKEGNNAHYLLNHPASNSLRKIPVLKKLPDFLEKVHNEEEEAAKILLEEARQNSETFEDIIKQGTYEELAKQHNMPAKDIEEIIAQSQPEALRAIINAFGSPNAIQRAANLLSSVFVEKKNMDKSDFDKKVRTLLLEIRKRDFASE